MEGQFSRSVCPWGWLLPPPQHSKVQKGPGSGWAHLGVQCTPEQCDSSRDRSEAWPSPALLNHKTRTHISACALRGPRPPASHTLGKQPTPGQRFRHVTCAEKPRVTAAASAVLSGNAWGRPIRSTGSEGSAPHFPAFSSFPFWGGDTQGCGEKPTPSSWS